jgi:hypothetical protein
MCTRAGFAYEEVTETVPSMQRDGHITIVLGKPHVEASDVTSVSLKLNPLAAAASLDVANAWVENEYFLNIPLFCARNFHNGIATVNYIGGFDPLPSDIGHAARVMAARMFSARSSKYSDVVGSEDSGTLAFQKAMPNDWFLLERHYRRWNRD